MPESIRNSELAAHSRLIECCDGIGHSSAARLSESRQLNHTNGGRHVFLYLDYAAVKVRKKGDADIIWNDSSCCEPQALPVIVGAHAAERRLDPFPVAPIHVIGVVSRKLV